MDVQRRRNLRGSTQLRGVARLRRSLAPLACVRLSVPHESPRASGRRDLWKRGAAILLSRRKMGEGRRLVETAAASRRSAEQTEQLVQQPRNHIRRRVLVEQAGSFLRLAPGTAAGRFLRHPCPNMRLINIAVGPFRLRRSRVVPVVTRVPLRLAGRAQASARRSLRSTNTSAHFEHTTRSTWYGTPLRHANVWSRRGRWRWCPSKTSDAPVLVLTRSELQSSGSSLTQTSLLPSASAVRFRYTHVSSESL